MLNLCKKNSKQTFSLKKDARKRFRVENFSFFINN